MASSETQVPSFDRLMWPAICALKQMGGSASHHELLDKVIEIAKIPEDAQSVAHTTGRESRVGYNLRWAQSYLGKYGGLENTSRGVWALTAKGRRLKESDIKEVVAAVRKMNQVKRRSGNGVAEPEGVPETGGGWKDELIGVVQGMTADGFERLCQRILRESGFLGHGLDRPRQIRWHVAKSAFQDRENDFVHPFGNEFFDQRGFDHDFGTSQNRQ